MTGISDKDLFPCAYPEWQDMRIHSTFWDDFSIADAFGPSAIRETFNEAFREWSSNYRMLTELTMVLNHKIWQHYKLGHEDKAKLYDKLWRRADKCALNTLKGSELEHFVMVTD